MCGPIFDERETTATAADRAYQASRGFQAPAPAPVVEMKPLSETTIRALARKTQWPSAFVAGSSDY
jgi:hypothetical protein